MKKTKWTQYDFVIGDEITIIVQNGTRYPYVITDLDDRTMHVTSGGKISFTQCPPYDILFDNRDTSPPLYTYHIKDFL